MENLIIYGIYLFLFGILAGIFASALKRPFKESNGLFIASTLIGFFSGLAFLLNFSGQELVVAKFPVFFNFQLSLDFLSGIFFALLNGISALVFLYGGEYLKRYRSVYDIQNVQFLTGFFILGMAGVLVSSGVIGFMIFWEMMSIASFLLVVADRSKESVRAGFIYFIMTHLGAGAILAGFLILNQGSLAFNLNDIADAVENISPFMLSVSFLLLLFGFGSKAGLIPFHIWLPEAHPQAPTNISALMSGLMLKISLYGFLRIILAVSGLPAWTAILVIAFGIMSALFGALYAAVEKDIKRAFAYSSIENMGIVFTMLGIALHIMSVNSLSEADVAAAFLVAYAIFHAINHAIFKTGLFLSSGVVISRVHSKSLEKMGGFAKAMPVFSFAFLMIILGSAALPPFGTFYGEWGFVRSLIQLTQNSVASPASLAIFLIVLPIFALVSGLAVFAMVKIFSISMLGLPRTHWHKSEGDNDSVLVYPIAILGVLMVLSGIFAKFIIEALVLNIGSMSVKTISSNAIIFSPAVFAIFILFLGLVWILHRISSGNENRKRDYHTWNCGQSIDASMEYTATAFAAPIRFFFLPLLRRFKEISAVPVTETNPWIVKKSFSLSLGSNWQEKFYGPIFGFIFRMAENVRRIHNGRIQYYLLLILATLIITLIFTLR